MQIQEFPLLLLRAKNTETSI